MIISAVFIVGAIGILIIAAVVGWFWLNKDNPYFLKPQARKVKVLIFDASKDTVYPINVVDGLLGEEGLYIPANRKSYKNIKVGDVTEGRKADFVFAYWLYEDLFPAYMTQEVVKEDDPKKTDKKLSLFKILDPENLFLLRQSVIRNFYEEQRKIATTGLTTKDMLWQNIYMFLPSIALFVVALVASYFIMNMVQQVSTAVSTIGHTVGAKTTHKAAETAAKQVPNVAKSVISAAKNATKAVKANASKG